MNLFYYYIIIMYPINNPKNIDLNNMPSLNISIYLFSEE